MPAFLQKRSPEKCRPSTRTCAPVYVGGAHTLGCKHRRHVPVMMSGKMSAISHSDRSGKDRQCLPALLAVFLAAYGRASATHAPVQPDGMTRQPRKEPRHDADRTEARLPGAWLHGLRGDPGTLPDACRADRRGAGPCTTGRGRSSLVSLQSMAQATRDHPEPSAAMHSLSGCRPSGPCDRSRPSGATQRRFSGVLGRSEPRSAMLGPPHRKNAPGATGGGKNGGIGGCRYL